MKHTCEFLDFRSSGVGVYVPLGCGAASRSDYYIRLHDHVLALSSRVQMFVMNQSLSDLAPHSGRTDTLLHAY